MNKKKSKALAFLLTASLLVPSANGIVSAAELRGSGVAATQAVDGSSDTEIAEGTVKVSDGNVNTLQSAIKSGTKKIIIEKNIECKNTIVNVNVDNIEIVGSNKDITLSGEYIFNITAKNVKIDTLTFNHTKENAVDGNLLLMGKGITTTINNCNFVGKPVWNLISNTNQDSKLNFTNNNVNMKARAMIVGVTNGSVIKGNTIDLLEEKYNDSNRTGVLSVIAYKTEENDDNKVTIEGNTFKNVNRVIGMDNGVVQDGNMYIKNNKFEDCRFAAEVAPNGNNKDQSYDLSNNYFEFDGKVSALKVQDAEKRKISGNNDYTYSYEGNNSPELVLEALKDSEDNRIIKAYPYYSELNINSDGSVSGKTVVEAAATINGISYNSLEDAIAAITESNKEVKVVLQRDVELRNNINIPKDKIVKITSPSKYKIELMGSDLIQIAQGGSLILENVELRSNLSSKIVNKKEIPMNYIVQSGNLTINNCNITATENVTGITNIVKSGGADVPLTLTGSTITVNARGGFVGVGSGSEIIGNTFDFKSEHYKVDEAQRTGVISVVAKDDNKKVTIRDNTFMNANRGIGLDHSTISGNSIEIKKNKFENVRFGAEINPKDKNKGKKYDFSENYFYHKEAGGVGPMKIQDASKENESGKPPVFNNFSYVDGNGLETALLEIEDYKDQNLEENIEQWPYYKDKDCNHLSNESYIPSTPSKPVYTHEEIIGSDRYDTAAKIADKLGSYDTVVLVNATSTMSDGLSASGLAGKENGAILLVKKDSIPKVTMDRIKKVKKVYIIGGENAISAKVANEITAAKIEVERLGGKTRVETSEIVAEKLGNYKDAFVVNGFKGEADAMSASAVAAKNGAPILLTNGKSSTHDKKSGVKYYVIGGNNVVDKSIADKYSAEVLAGKDRYATNREVIDEFYSGSDKLYLANGDKLVDALTASPLAKKNGIVLVNEKSDKSILKGKNTVQVGGMDFEIKFEK